MLSGQAAKVEEGTAQLVKYLNNPSEKNAEGVKKIEKEADELRRVLVRDLNRTFVTPIDREDIYALSRVVDDILDYVNTTAEEMVLFKIKSDGHICKMVEILLEASKNLHGGIDTLNRDAVACEDHLLRARKAENSIEDCYRRGLVELFETDDVIKILKTREVYRHLSNAADRVVEAANITSNILVKIT